MEYFASDSIVKFVLYFMIVFRKEVLPITSQMFLFIFSPFCIQGIKDYEDDDFLSCSVVSTCTEITEIICNYNYKYHTSTRTKYNTFVSLP